MFLRVRSMIPAALGAALLALSIAPFAAAHSGIEVGDYLLTIGWRDEPTYVGQPNAVQVVVLDHHDESPILDKVALQVVVETAGQSSDPLPLDPAFDAVERTGSLGEYAASVIPTAPGDYTFHITGTIATTDVDLSLKSGDETFDAVKGSSEAQFPVTLPNLGEVATRLDRIDARIAALQSADPGTEALDVAREASDAAHAAATSATDAAAAANQALLVGGALGLGGIIVGAIGIWLAIRAGRRGTAAA